MSIETSFSQANAGLHASGVTKRRSVLPPALAETRTVSEARAAPGPVKTKTSASAFFGPSSMTSNSMLRKGLFVVF